MSSIIQLLSILSDGKFHSGEELGRHLGLSRSAIWKKIGKLEKYGLVVYSIKGKGYRLSKPVDLLNREKILSLLDEDAKSIVKELTVLEEVDSTNQYLLNQIDNTGFHAHVVLAEYQTLGRGRRGHTWISPYASGITMSLGWHFETPPELLTGISLGAGVAIMRTLHRLGIDDAGLKWPNDIIWRRRKLGGSLVELKAESTGPCNMVIGIGINYSFPSNIVHSIDQPWVDMTSIQPEKTSRNLAIAILLSELFRVLLQVEDEGTGNIINEWRKHDIMKDKQATLLLPASNIQGMVRGIDDSGALIMSINGKIKKFNSGEISLRIRH